jgi:CDP-diglyceride synthetase
MRNLFAAALSMTLIAPAAFAGDAGSLAIGKPAGVKQAQAMNSGNTALFVIGGIVAAGVAIGLATSSNGNPGGPVTLTTVPTTTS